VPPSLRSNLAYTAKYVLYKLTYTVITVTKIPDHTPRLQKTSYTRNGQLIAGMILNVIDASARILAKDWKTLISGPHFPVTFPETKCSTLPSRAERNKNDLSDDIVLMSLGYRPDFCKYFGEIAPLIIKAPGWSRVSQILGITIGNYGGKEGKFGTRVGKRVQNNTRSANKPTQKKHAWKFGSNEKLSANTSAKCE
jgi:hypothetical protein